jgi:hypothetical protein
MVSQAVAGRARAARTCGTATLWPTPAADGAAKPPPETDR